MQRPGSRRLGRVLVVAALGLALVTAVAAAPRRGEAEGQIAACRHKVSGLLRVPAAGVSCRRNEQAISWSVGGERGPQGPAGPKGDPGHPGPDRPDWPNRPERREGRHRRDGSGRPGGPAGQAGAQGVAGPVGPAGPAGPAGAAGASLTSIGQLNGVACTPAAGGSGSVAVTVASGGAISLACNAGTTPPPPPPPGGSLVINEIDYDQVGADSNGFVEIRNNGASAASLSGLALVLVDGTDGIEYDREALTGSIAAGGYLVVAIEAQNGAPDGVALVNTATGALVDALSYEGAITAAQIGTATTTVSLVEGTVLAATVADSNTAAGSLIRNPDGHDTNNAATDWVFTTTVTRGAANVATSG